MVRVDFVLRVGPQLPRCPRCGTHLPECGIQRLPLGRVCVQCLGVLRERDEHVAVVHREPEELPRLGGLVVEEADVFRVHGYELQRIRVFEVLRLRIDYIARYHQQVRLVVLILRIGIRTAQVLERLTVLVHLVDEGCAVGTDEVILLRFVGAYQCARVAVRAYGDVVLVLVTAVGAFLHERWLEVDSVAENLRDGTGDDCVEDGHLLAVVVHDRVERPVGCAVGGTEHEIGRTASDRDLRDELMLLGDLTGMEAPQLRVPRGIVQLRLPLQRRQFLGDLWSVPVFGCRFHEIPAPWIVVNLFNKNETRLGMEDGKSDGPMEDGVSRI